MARRTRIVRITIALAVANLLLTACSGASNESVGEAPSSSSTPTSTSAPLAGGTLPDGVLPLPEPSGTESFVVVEAGRYRVPVSDTLAYAIDLPQGTYVHDGKYLAFDETRPPGIGGVLYVDAAGEGAGVSLDPCTSQHDIVPAGTTVDELVTAIINHPILEVSEPAPAELGGARGQYLEVRIPDDYDASSCVDGEVGLVGRPEMVRNALPGYVGAWWVLDIAGERILLQPYCPGPCPRNWAERLRAVAETITFTRFA